MKKFGILIIAVILSILLSGCDTVFVQFVYDFPDGISSGKHHEYLADEKANDYRVNGVAFYPHFRYTNHVEYTVYLKCITEDADAKIRLKGCNIYEKGNDAPIFSDIELNETFELNKYEIEGYYEGMVKAGVLAEPEYAISTEQETTFILKMDVEVENKGTTQSKTISIEITSKPIRDLAIFYVT